MQIEYINITSYRGISSDAEHYYAKYHTPSKDDYDAFIDGEKPYSFDEDLMFFPERQQAVELCRKDNQMVYGVHAPEITGQQIERMMTEGTIRFPSILEIVKAARKKFSGAILCFYYHGSHRAFADLLNSINNSDSRQLEQIIELLKGTHPIKDDHNG